MNQPAFAAVDWGTSSFRLWLMGSDGIVLAERRSSEGMTAAAGIGFPQVLTSHLDAVAASADLPVIICGMAGARQGWIEAGYVDVPSPLHSLPRDAVRIPGETRNIRILPGLAQRRKDAPDVMRGEETQLLGALDPQAGGEQLVCMPGTHSKWVNVAREAVTGFSTYMTGELFEVISRHSVLSHALVAAEAFDGRLAAFTDAVKAAFRTPQQATSLLFTVRSGTLLHELSPTDAAARLSGTLIGVEIAGGLTEASTVPAIRLVASGRLRNLYEGAFDALSLAYETIDADEAVRQGLTAAAREILLSNS